METKGYLVLSGSDRQQIEQALVAAMTLADVMPLDLTVTISLRPKGQQNGYVNPDVAIAFPPFSNQRNVVPVLAEQEADWEDEMGAGQHPAPADPRPARLAAVSAEPGEHPRIDRAELTAEQQEMIDRLNAGTLTWVQLLREDKAAILTGVLIGLTNHFEQKISMLKFNELRPSWLPQASALAAMFASQQWKTLLTLAAERRLE